MAGRACSPDLTLAWRELGREAIQARSPAHSLTGGGKARASPAPMVPDDDGSDSESDNPCPLALRGDYEVAISMQQSESAHFGSERREPVGDKEFAQRFASEVRPRTPPHRVCRHAPWPASRTSGPTPTPRPRLRRGDRTLAPLPSAQLGRCSIMRRPRWPYQP